MSMLIQCCDIISVDVMALSMPIQSDNIINANAGGSSMGIPKIRENKDTADALFQEYL